MPSPLVAAALVFGAVTIATLGGFALTGGHERATQRRVEAIARAPQAGQPRTALLATPFARRALWPMLAALGQVGQRLTPLRHREHLGELLLQSGASNTQGVQVLLAMKALLLGLGLVAWALLHPVRPGLDMIVGAAIAMLGVLGPERYLKARIQTRQEAIVKALPDTLDLLTSCVEAGLSFDGGLLRISARSTAHGRELRAVLAGYLADVRMGATRPEALDRMATACGVRDLDGVVAALVQADQLGVGVGQVLRTQSQHLRARRRQRAQESALKAPVKMLFPLVFFIFPAMFLVTLGPAILRIMDTFAKQP